MYNKQNTENTKEANKINTSEIRNFDEIDRLGLMGDYKPFMHLHRTNNTLTLRALIKIPEAKSHTSTCIVHRGTNKRYIKINIDDEPTVLKSYLISIIYTFDAPFEANDPVIGVEVHGPGTPEEGATMVGEHDADEHP